MPRVHRPARDTPSDRYVDLAQAVQLLDVKPATLYTYVSRGLIRRLAVPGRRTSLYLLEDVERMRARSDARASDGVLAAAAIRYGEPVVPTSVTEITPEGPRYRNRSAIDLAASGATFETTAELLWTGMMIDGATWRCELPPRALLDQARELAGLGVTSLHDIFASIALAHGMARGTPPARLAETSAQLLLARQLVYALCGCFAMLGTGGRYRAPREGESVAQALARSLRLDATPAVVDVLNGALVLSADHELNPATFVARIAASGDCDLHSCIAAAIATNSGTRIARGCDRIEKLLLAHRPGRAVKRGADADARGELATLGFHHPLYPGGDPRGRALVALVRRLGPPSPRLTGILADLDSLGRGQGVTPRLEAALAVLGIALRLPEGAAAGIYTLGRVAGWVAHIAEQRLAGFLIRPRARFVA